MGKISFNRADILCGVLVAAIFSFFSFQAYSFFESLEKIIYGIEMRLDLPRTPGRGKIAIVNIDEKSLKQLGPWPWPRRYIAEMISILRSNGAKIIGLDILYPEKEQNQGLAEVERLYKEIKKRRNGSRGDAWILRELKSIEERLDNDRRLVETIEQSGNVVLPVVGRYGKYDTELLLDDSSLLKRLALDVKIDADGILPVNQLIAPFPELLKNSLGIGHINLSPNELMKGQVHLLFINYRGLLIPSLPFRLTLDYLGQQAEDVIVKGKGIRLKREIIPAFQGQIFIKFNGGRRSFPYYSFADILRVKKVPAVFKDKIVLIGYTADGSNAVSTPVDASMPRIELIANIIENLMTGRYLKRPGNMVFIEIILLFIFTIVAALFMPPLNLVNRLGLAIGLIFLAIIIGVTSFMSLDLWFKAVYITLSVITMFAFLSIKDFVIRQRALGLSSQESIETNRMLGLSLQSQGLLDLAYEKFRKCPLDETMMDVVYNLGLDYERKRMPHKAVSVYEYILQNNRNYRDLNQRVAKLKKLVGPSHLVGKDGQQEGKIVIGESLDITPTVGRYEIIGELGQGAMGIVYKARDPKINRLVAIKTIRFSDEFEEGKINDIKQRFFREAEIAGKLSHRSIVAIYDVGEDYDLTYMAMEYLEGENLIKYCQKDTLLPIRKVLYLVEETASALNYAHGQGVIHRDIKPANIMLLKNGRVKVTDFGIAKAVSSSETKSGIILGTPNYMSPEQINGQKIDGRSDIFSLGIVLFQLLTGQLPFHGETLTNLFYQITQVKHPPPRSINPKIPRPLEQIVDRALAKDPSERFQRVEELAKYLRALINKIDQIKAKKARQKFMAS
ncbi:MAG: CHASE2 domain-containing protein [Deltaproteobacteria bacterium]|nr:CHASE2 domain-containing protein [Deltaproteobacteria bacterium]